MKRSTARWTTSLAAAALLGLPAATMAQTPTQPPTTSTQQSTPPQSSTTQNADAQEHLRQAKAALDAVAPTAVTGRNKTQLAELKRHVNALEKAAGSNSNASTTGAANRSARATAAKGNWSTEVAAADKILTNLLGAAGTTGSTSDPTATSGTSGSTSAKPAASANLDEATRTQLMEVRTHLTAFAAAMSGTSAPSADPTASSSTAGTSSATGTSSSTGTSSTGSMTGSTSGTTGSTAGTTGSATGTTGSTTAQDPTQTAAAQPQVDADAARRHLTDARDTLAQLTQLPAAAQLSGEARTQVSQLISNFNELITTQSEWRASYGKLEANLNALIGPDNTDAEPTGGVSTGTTGTTGTAGAAGTAGTAGTTGSTAGVANLDPAIRAKLVELRQKLNAFEKAAGGDATAGSTGAAATTGSTAGSMTGSTTGSTGSMTGSTTGSTGSMTGQTPQSATQSPAEAAGHQEAMRHIAAIEAILNANGAGASSSTAGTTGSATSGTTGTSGSATATTGANLTLTSAQLEQLRTHLAELKRLVGEAKK